MINSRSIEQSLDAVLGDNMFLKDAQKASDLKASIAVTVSQINDSLSLLEGMSNETTQKLYNFRKVFKNYLQDQISLSSRYLDEFNDVY